MSEDPLKIFREAVASEESASSTSLASKTAALTRDELIGRKVPRDIETTRPEVIATTLAFGGGAAGFVGRRIANQALKNVAQQGSVAVPRGFQYKLPGGGIGLAPAPAVGTIKELRSQILAGTSKDPSVNLMGVFDVTQRKPKFPQPMSDSNKAFAEVKKKTKAATEELGRIQDSVDSFIKKYDLERKGVKINLRSGLGSKILVGPGAYAPGSKSVFSGRVGRDVLLHELGHAADYTSGTLGKVRSRLNPILANSAKWMIPTLLLAGDQIKKALPGTVDDKVIEFTQRHAPVIAGATIAATTLYPEAKASMLAIRHVAETEGRAAAKLTAKRLSAGFGTYLFSAIPSIVGIALAKKWMERRNELSDEESPEELAKTASIFQSFPILRQVRGSARDLAHIGKQVTEQSAQIIRDRKVISSLGRSAKKIGTDPDAAITAVSTGLPAAMASLYFYGTPSGKILRGKLSEREKLKAQPLGSRTKIAPGLRRTEESWREKHPLQFAGLVGLGAAVAGGVMSRFFLDLARVA